MKHDFDTTFSFVQNGLYVYDLAQKCNIYVNKHYTNILGYTLNDLNKLSENAFITLFHPDDQKAITNHMLVVSKLKKGEIATIEYRFKSKNKDWVWCLSQDAGYEYDNTGKAISIIGSFSDITKQKQTEFALNEITRSYKEMVENSPFGMHFYSLNDANQLVFESANPAANQLLGTDHGQYIGKTIGEAFPSLQNTEIPQRYFDAAKHGTPWTNEQVLYQDENISSAYKVTAFQTKSGSMVAVFDDISDEKKAQHAIKKSEALYRLLADTSTDMIARHDKAGIFLYVSPACRDLLGYEPEELVGHSAFDYFHPDDLAKLEENRNTIIEKPVRTTVTFRFRKKNGDYTWFETNTHTLFDEENNNIVELHASSRDVSERVKADQLIQQQNLLLEELNASKDKFFSILSHDLRSPLSSISSLLDVFRRNILDYQIEEIKAHMAIITNSTKNLLSLVDDILLWASSQSGQIPFNPQKINFLNFANETLKVAKSTAQTKSIEISIANASDIYLIADVNMLKTILRNLVSNAVKFTNKGGKIEITIMQDQQFTTISVIDNGIGMSKELSSNLFDNIKPFSKSENEEEPVSGIGLILVKEFIQKHNGTIWAESTLGEGSTFSFCLPNKTY